MFLRGSRSSAARSSTDDAPRPEELEELLDDARDARSRSPRGCAAAARACPATCSRDGCRYPGICRASHDGGAGSFTDEQLVAIERRDGDLLLDAGAGSGKTSVLVERFVRSVLEDGIDVGGDPDDHVHREGRRELRDRIRARLRELGAHDAARATEGAFISTIHGFCARVLRAHALAAGLDPAFAVLDAQDAERLARRRVRRGTRGARRERPGAIDLIAAYGPAACAAPSQQVTRAALAGSAGPAAGARPRRTLGSLRDELSWPRAAALAELAAIGDPEARCSRLARLERSRVLGGADPWPGELGRVALPGGNGAALSTEACVRYAEALAASGAP